MFTAAKIETQLQPLPNCTFDGELELRQLSTSRKLVKERPKAAEKPEASPSPL